MLVFVDESGDPGLEIERGATRLFHVGIVIFADNEEALSCDKKIDQLRKDLRLHPDAEFHFNKLKKERRISFLKSVAQYNWFYLAITINKKKLYGKGFKFAKSFYKYAVKLVFLNASQYLQSATVVFDGRDSRRFQRQLATYLRQQINVGESRKIAKVKVQKSHRNNLLQLADMVVGAVARSYQKKKKDYASYRSIIQHRELHSQIWPK
ncbi:DUF3800 domain-containing protein [bacterium]|nr:DUF3800 domain-containing protein [bacterium]